MNAFKSLLEWPVRRFNLTGATAVVAGPFTWLVLFFLVPFVLVVKISFAELQLGIPPYTELASYADGVVHIALNLSHYAFLFTDSLYFATYVNSVWVAAITTLLCLLLGYPMAYYIARSNPATRNLLMMGVMLPFWTSFLIRVYAWIGILKNNGLLNNFLMWIGLTHTPIELYRTNYAVYIGMVYSYLPFLVMPLYAHLVKMDLRLLEAAYDLGAKPWKAFVQITLPLSKNGIIAGCLLVFIPAVGEYVIPELLGGANTLMIGRVMWNEFFNNADWPMASAVTCAMVLLLLVPMAMFQHFQAKEQGGASMKPNRYLQFAALFVGFAFLYVPIISLIVYSFNESKLVTVWSGFSFRWYAALAEDDELLTAAWLSLKIGVLTAFASVFIGTWAGFVLARMGRFRGFALFSGMINAPLVIPEVIQGISLLLLFIELAKWIGWPAERGVFTIWLGHVMLCISYVAIIVQSRVRELNPSLEEAALDLGATPLKVFFTITLPLISQALIAGWLLSFTLSIDDLVLSAFLSGPGSTTLPLVVFSRVRLGLNPEMNALATLFIIAVTAGVVIANFVMLRQERKRLAGFAA
ncbi:ABC transporter, permease protein [Burkholderia cenocepacia K56-2Valvano]|nr:ABC transporter, permease protein [Burkholderia cenocepacia K56-2Valvano]